MNCLWKHSIISIVSLGILGAGGYAAYAHWFKAKPKTEVKKADSPYCAFARGRIDVDGGLVNIAAKKDGIIKDMFVEEGDKVKKDQILCKQDDKLEKLTLELRKAAVTEVERKIERLKIDLEAALREDKRHRELAQKGVVSSKDFDALHDKILTCKGDLAMSEAALVTAKNNQTLAEYDIEQRIVRAPADGMILRCDVRPGYGTTSSSNVTRLFVFVPELPFIVRAELEEKFVKSIKPGMKADVIPDADESKTYKATVIRVGNYLGPKRMTFDDPQEKSDVKTAECVLSIEGKDLILQQRVLVKFLKNQDT